MGPENCRAKGNQLQAIEKLHRKRREIVNTCWNVAGHNGDPQEGTYFKNTYKGGETAGTREWTQPPPEGQKVCKQKINARSMATEFMPVVINDEHRGGKMPGICIRTKTHPTMEDVMEIDEPLVLSDLINSNFVVAVNICRWTTQFAELDYSYPSTSQYLWDQNRVEH